MLIFNTSVAEAAASVGFKPFSYSDLPSVFFLIFLVVCAVFYCFMLIRK